MKLIVISDVIITGMNEKVVKRKKSMQMLIMR